MGLELKAAVNSFSEGLLMDFSPTIAPNSALSNALNATLITYNGNEMSLQNDMGNARVESAYLPEGYVPVGTCEFGDIIYIVSYNPLKNKSQIGCFPSPERNISSKEISNLKTTLSSSDLAKDGTIYNNSIKKIIYQNTLNAGDKFIISWGSEGIRNLNSISNFGNTQHNLKNNEGYWPKITKIYIVSIDETGKMTYLSDDVKWYTNKSNNTKYDYIISDQVFMDNEGVPTNDLNNIDQYRTALASKYSVFQSKTSGKLALLLELETITGFNCGHKLIQHKAKDGDYTIFDVYFSASWTTDNYNINPSGMLVTKSELVNMKEYGNDSNYLVPNKNNPLDPSKVMEFSRLYKIEDPQNSYEEFLKKSYYNQVDKYSTFRAKLYSDYNNIKDTTLSDVITSITEAEVKPGVSKIKSNTASGIIDPGSSTPFDPSEVKAEKLKDSISNLLYFDDKIKNIIREYKLDETTGVRRPYEKTDGSGDIQRYYIPNAESYKQGKYYTTINDKIYEAAPVVLPDDIVVNLFKKSVLIKVGSFVKENITKDSSDAQYLINYTVCPCMPYGPLSYLSINNTIDFNKNLDGRVELNTWKYYVTSNSLTLNFGFDTFLKEDENEVIDKVVMEFYDPQGLCASYMLNNQETYDAKFTEYFILDTDSENDRMSNIKYSHSSNIQSMDKILHASGNNVITRGNIETEDLTNYIAKVKELPSSELYNKELLNGEYLIEAKDLKEITKSDKDFIFKEIPTAKFSEKKVVTQNNISYTVINTLYYLSNQDIDKLPEIFSNAFRQSTLNNAENHFEKPIINGNLFQVENHYSDSVYYYKSNNTEIFGGKNGDPYIILNDVGKGKSQEILVFSFIDDTCQQLDSWAIYTIKQEDTSEQPDDIENPSVSKEWEETNQEQGPIHNEAFINEDTCSKTIKKVEQSQDSNALTLISKLYDKQIDSINDLNINVEVQDYYIIVSKQKDFIEDNSKLYIGYIWKENNENIIKEYSEIDYDTSVYTDIQYQQFILYTKNEKDNFCARIYDITYSESNKYPFALKTRFSSDKTKIDLGICYDNEGVKLPEGYSGKCEVVGDNFKKTYTIQPSQPYISIDYCNCTFFITISNGCDKYSTSGKITYSRDNYYPPYVELSISNPNKDYYQDNNGSYVFNSNQLLANVYIINNKEYYLGRLEDNKWKIIDSDKGQITIYNTCDITIGIFKSNDPNSLIESKTFSFISSIQQELLYRNDAGILYYGRPYLVKINIYKGNIDDLGNIDTDAYLDPLVMWRWLWTAPVFNDQYNAISDFKDCQLTVGLDSHAEFNSVRLAPNYNEYIIPTTMTDPNISYDKEKGIGFNVSRVGWDSINKEYNSFGNISFRGEPVSTDTYGNSLFLNTQEDILNNINVTLGIANPRIITEDTSVVYDDDNTTGDFNALFPVKGIPNSDSLFVSKEDIYSNKGDKDFDLSKAKDTFNLTFANRYTTDKETFNYLDSEGNLVSNTCSTFSITASEWKNETTPVYLNLTGCKFNKVSALTRTLQNKVRYIKSIVETEEDLFNYGIKIDKYGKPYYETIPYLGYSEPGGEKTHIFAGYLKFRNSQDTYPYFCKTWYDSTGQELKSGGDNANLNSEFLSPFKENVINSPLQQFIFGPGPKYGEIHSLRIKGLSPTYLNKYMGDSSDVEAITGSIDGANFYPNTQATDVKLSANEEFPDSSRTLPPFANKNATRYIYTLLGINNGGNIYGLGDGGILKSTNGDLTQNLAWKSDVAKPSQTSAYNYAQIVASLLMQLYSVQEEAEDKFSFSNIARLKDFKEYWKADIMVKLNLSTEGEKILKNKYILISPHYDDNKNIEFIRLYDYVASIQIAAGVSDKSVFIDGDTQKDINDASVFIDSINVVPDIKESIRCFEFNYEMPYDVQKLIDTYYNVDTSNLKYIHNVYNYDWYQNSSDAETIEIKTIAQSLNPNTLYTDNNGTFSVFSGGSTFYLLDRFKTVGNTVIGYKTKDLYKLDINKYSKLSESAKVDGKNLQFKDPSIMDMFDQTYDFQVVCSGDNPRVAGLKQTHLFNYGKLK